MSASDPLPVEEYTTIESIFVRHRNALFVRGQFTPIYTDYYLHLMQNKLRHKEELDTYLKETITALTLHLTARPWAETVAWTVNMRAPRINLFVTGSSTKENIVGHLFTENVKEPDQSILHSQTIDETPHGRQSKIALEDKDPLSWLEQYYQQSEQRPARAFRLEDENFALIAAQPDCDLEWLESLTVADVNEIMNKEQTKLLETRKFKFHCGCSLERILPSLSAYKGKADALFEGASELEIQCPRCGTHYIITPDMFD